jgi:hypothetical protein
MRIAINLLIDVWGSMPETTYDQLLVVWAWRQTLWFIEFFYNRIGETVGRMADTVHDWLLWGEGNWAETVAEFLCVEAGWRRMWLIDICIGRMVVTVIDRLLCMSRMAESASQKLNSISEQLHTSGTFFKGEPFTQLSYRQSNQLPSRCFQSSLHICTVHIEPTVRLFQFTYIPS